MSREAAPAIEIEIAPAWLESVSGERLIAAVAATLEHENARGGVTLLVGDDDTIADLNRRFRGEDGPTDVLSFPAQGDGTFVLPPTNTPYLGDIIIAYPYASRQAAAQGHDVATELDLLAVHGTLHLLGYDHGDAEEEAVMWARQRAILHRLHQQ